MVTVAQVKSLRARTGVGLNACKDALVASNGDEEKAIDLLRQKGIASQNKRADKDASEGIVAMKLDGNAGTLLSLRCETDFVARNEQFWGVARDLCSLSIVNSKELEHQALNGTKVSDRLAELQVVTKENVQLGEVITLKAQDSTFVHGYVHGSVGLAKNIGNFGVLVRTSSADVEFGKFIAMHIAAMNPEVLADSDLTEETLEREKAIAMSQVDANKPQEIIEKMVQGKIQKALKDRVLLNQPYAFNTKLTVEQFAKESGIQIIEFKKIIIGKA